MAPSFSFRNDDRLQTLCVITKLSETDRKPDLTPYCLELMGGNPGGCRLKPCCRRGGNTMRKRVTPFRATVLGCRVYYDREVGDDQAQVLGQRHQDDIWVRWIKQRFVLDHHGGTQLVRFLRESISPVGNHDLTTRKLGQRLASLASGRTPLVIKCSRLGRTRDIFSDGTALRSYPLSAQARRSVDGDLPEICRKPDATRARFRLQRFSYVVIQPY
jgi:hypothetical protein